MQKRECFHSGTTKNVEMCGTGCVEDDDDMGTLPLAGACVFGASTVFREFFCKCEKLFNRYGWIVVTYCF